MKLKTHIENKLGVFTKTNAWIFVIIKPGFESKTQDIIKRFEQSGWELSQIKTKRLLPSEARELYSIHKKEDWYKPLCEYMSSGLTTAIIFVKPSQKLNKAVFKETGEIKEEIRSKWSESDMRNVIHSSDSIEHMLKESSIYFVI